MMLVDVSVDGGQAIAAHVDSLESGRITLPEIAAPIRETVRIAISYEGSRLTRILSDPERAGVGLVVWRMNTHRADGATRY